VGYEGDSVTGSKPFAVFSKWDGINNVDDGMELSPSELQKGQNIDLDDAGRPSRRKGFTPIPALAGNFRWMWSDGVTCLAINVTDRSLVQIFPNYSTSLLLDGVDPDRRMEYEKVLDRIYYTNDQIIGFVQGGNNYTLPVAQGAFKATLPPGKFLKQFNSRLWVVVGNKHIMSDIGKYDQYDERYFGKQYENPITMSEIVNNGMFISAGKTFFLAMTDPMEQVKGALVEKAPYGAIPYTAVSIDGGLVVKDKTISGKVIIWGSEEGICLGADGGEFENLTIQKYELPAGKMGAALYRKKNHKGTSQVVMTIAQ